MWLLGLVSSTIGVFVGGGIAWFMKAIKKKVNFVYALCAGFILCLIGVEIFPDAVELGGWSTSIVWVIIGMLSFGFLHKVLDDNHSIVKNSKKEAYFHTGWLLMVSFSVHNFPMGITLGTSRDTDFTTSMLQTLLFHSIPEGIILFMPLLLAGMSGLMLLGFSLIVSMPVALGVLIGRLFEFEYNILAAPLISFTVGIILMVTITEILLPSLKQTSSIRIVLYTLIGFGIMYIYLLVIS